jgi:hypothetical protein
VSTHGSRPHLHDNLMDWVELPLAESVEAIAALPRPIVHVKGWASRMLLTGAPSAARLSLSMSAQGQLDRERSAAEKAAEKLIGSICELAPRTIVWDGDIYAPDSFTALIPRLMRRLPGLSLAAFMFGDKVQSFKETWSAQLAELPASAAPSGLNIFTIPAYVPTTPPSPCVPPTPDQELDQEGYYREWPAGAPGRKFVHLGRVALRATGAVHVFFLGGGLVSAEEARLALHASAGVSQQQQQHELPLPPSQQTAIGLVYVGARRVRARTSETQTEAAEWAEANALRKLDMEEPLIGRVCGIVCL